MTTADYALLTSIASIFISIGALLWNVWQKFIFVKPSLQVAFRVSRVFQPTGDGTATRTDIRLLNLTVTNMGPGVAVLYLCIAKMKTHWWKRAEYATLNPIHGNPIDPEPIGIGPIAGGLPAKIDLGELQSFYFPDQNDCFLQENVVRVGINDTYQRNIWCRRKDVRRAKKSYQRDFGETTEAVARNAVPGH
jgi:hypothetical protein